MKRKRGFTLIEVVLVAMLIAVVALLMYSFFGQGLSLYSMESKSAERQDNLRLALSDITNRVRLTDPAKVTYSSGVLTVNTTTYSYYSTGKEIRRDGRTLATGVSAFTVSLSSGLLQISISDTAGTVISTSLSLK